MLTFVYFLLWLLLSVGFTFLVTIYVQLAWACPQINNQSTDCPEKYFRFGEAGGRYRGMCWSEIYRFCACSMYVTFSFVVLDIIIIVEK